MAWLRVLQHVEPASDRQEAADMVSGLRSQAGCIGARVIGDGNTKPWAAQAFFPDEPDATWFPDGTRRVMAPEYLLDAVSR